MAVKIRLRRMGAKKAPFYRIVVADSRYPRNGRFIEEIGYYDPAKTPVTVQIDAEKAKKWMSNGAQQELIVTIVKGLVDDKDAVCVTVDLPKEDGTVVYHLHVAPDDMGRVIGKQGRIAKAIRTIVRSAAGKVEQKVVVEID